MRVRNSDSSAIASASVGLASERMWSSIQAAKAPWSMATPFWAHQAAQSSPIG